MSERARTLRATATLERPQGMRVLLAAWPLARLPAARVAAALAGGLQRGGLAAPEVLELPARAERSDLAGALEAELFDARLHLARALVLAGAEASERSLRTSPMFELATRARQAGVPAYAVAGQRTLTAFDARVLDLQLILRARSEKELARAGAQLAALLLAAAAANADSRGTRR